MNKKFNSGLAVMLPNKKINLFVFFVIMLGIISGTVFLLSLKEIDRDLVVNQITTFMSNINDNNINNFDVFKNTLIKNIIYTIVIWIFGMSIIGIIFNIFFIYLKGVILGFSISSFFIVYNYKGLLAGLIYVFPTYIINIVASILLGVYSVILTMFLWKVIFLHDKSNDIKRFMKKYLLILIICILLITVSSLCESYLVPSLFKLVIKLFI